MSWVLLLLLVAPLVSAQTIRCGRCPTTGVQPDFDLQRYLGRWFEITKLPANFERGKCIEANYALREDGTIQVLNKQQEENGISIIGTARIPDPREPAKLGVSFSFVAPTGTYWVLYTDYTSVSVVYSCTDFLRVAHMDYAWILARNRTLPEETMRTATEILKRVGVKECELIPTDQTGCLDNTM
uniref:Apolipoprotein D n=1 Tax=Neogobius melanostomus TaxID=47308 RepID=A0A8C6S9N2_9GOBI